MWSLSPSRTLRRPPPSHFWSHVPTCLRSSGRIPTIIIADPRHLPVAEHWSRSLAESRTRISRSPEIHSSRTRIPCSNIQRNVIDFLSPWSPGPPSSGASTQFDCGSYPARSAEYRYLALMDPGRCITPSRSNQMRNQSIISSKISRRFSLFDCGAYDSLDFKRLPALPCPHRPHRHASIYSRGHGTSCPQNPSSLRRGANSWHFVSSLRNKISNDLSRQDNEDKNHNMIGGASCGGNT